MRIVAHNVKVNGLSDGRISMIFDADYHSKARLEELSGDITMEISRKVKKRTNHQNGYLWALLGDISQIQNGNRNSDIDLYCSILEEVGAKVMYFQCLNNKEEIEALKQVFRVVKIAENRGDTVMLKCYVGTSKMDTVEMNKIIDKALEYAYEVGLDTAYWEGLLK